MKCSACKHLCISPIDGKKRCVRDTFRAKKDGKAHYEQMMQKIKDMPEIDRPYHYPDETETLFAHCFREVDGQDECWFYEQRKEELPKPGLLERFLMWLDHSYLPDCQYFYWRKKCKEAVDKAL